MKNFSNIFQITILVAFFSSATHAQSPTNVKFDKLKLSTPSEENVTITGGPWFKAMELERKYLLSLDPDRLLVHFRKTAGIPTKAKEYGGWEMGSKEVRGQAMGHYISAISRMAVLTHDQVLKDRSKYIVKELNRCQKKIGTGYVSAFPESYLDRVENVKEVWAPYYVLHKILAGLLDSYNFCGDKLALTTAVNLVHYLHDRTIKVGEAQFQKVLDNTEQGGINEVLWNIYAETGDVKSKELAEFFYAKADFDPLKDGKDKWKGLHANSTIPIVVGFAKEYELTGNMVRKQMSELFWRQITEGRMFVTGGTSGNDLWNVDPYHLSEELNPYAQESCATYNMLKLSKHLWGWNKDIKYQEYMEKALVNAILASQNPVTGMSLYHIPTAPGYYKTFSTPDSSFWCCTDTGMENFSRTSEYIYGIDGNTLYVNQFIPSKLNYKNEGFRLIQETNMPDGKNLSIKVVTDKTKSFKLAIRIPSWTGEDYSVTLNGKSLDAKSAPGSYLMLDRVWNNGDKIAISFTPHLWFSLLPLTNKYVAFGYGPVVLASVTDRPNAVQKTSDDGPYHGQPTTVQSINFDPKTFADIITEVDEQNLTFTMKSDSGKEIKLMPVYKVVDQYFSIYQPIGKVEVAEKKKHYDATDH